MGHRPRHHGRVRRRAARDHDFIREEELPFHAEQSSKEQEILEALAGLELRLDAIESRMTRK